MKLLGVLKYECQEILIGMTAILRTSLISLEIVLGSDFQPFSKFVVVFLSACDESGHDIVFYITFMSQLGTSTSSFQNE